MFAVIPDPVLFDHLRLTLRVSNFGSIIKSSMLDFATLALNAIQRLCGHDPRLGTGSPSKTVILNALREGSSKFSELHYT